MPRPRCTIRRSVIGTPLVCEAIKVSQSSRTPDPRHPDDRAMDSIEVTYQCPHCGQTKTRTQYPWLLDDLFSDWRRAAKPRPAKPGHVPMASID